MGGRGGLCAEHWLDVAISQMTVAMRLGLYGGLTAGQHVTRRPLCPSHCRAWLLWHWLQPVPSLCTVTLLAQSCPAEEMTRAEISS